MTEPSLLRAAVEELYSHPMAEFTTRRKALVAGARKAGDRESAAQIAGLRKATLSAETLNRLVRLAPAEVDELLELGGRLRAAQQALDAGELRELSVKRRQLVGELARLAFEITDQPTPSASVRDEVTETLNAALADEAVAERLTSGALVTQARWDGLGSISLPELAAVLPMDRVRPAARLSMASTPTGRTSTGDRRAALGPVATAPDANAPDTTAPDTTAPDASARDAGRTDLGAAPRPAAGEAARVRAARAAQVKSEQDAAARLTAERAAQATVKAAMERRRRLEAAQREAADADSAANRAKEALSAIDRQISELSMQLAHQRQQLATAQRALRAAEDQRRAAHLALTRAGGAQT